MGLSSKVVSLHTAPSGGAPMQTISEARAVAGRGLEGDRYFSGSGTYSNHPGNGRHVTVIEIESVDALKRECHVEIAPALCRRNIVTHDVALNHLVDCEFRVGEVVLRGMRLCEPCAHLEKLTAPGALRGLIHRGGLRAEILTGGMIRVGDPVVPLIRSIS